MNNLVQPGLAGRQLLEGQSQRGQETPKTSLHCLVMGRVQSCPRRVVKRLVRFAETGGWSPQGLLEAVEKLGMLFSPW